MPPAQLMQGLSLWGVRLAAALLVAVLAFLALRSRQALIALLLRAGLLDPQKAPTLQPLLVSLSRWTIWILAAIGILSLLGADVWQVLTGAGIASVALGLGAQNVVRDMIAGFFIMAEDQYRPGDYVVINGELEGVVEAMTLRMTRLRGWDGAVVCIGNATVSRLKNYNRDEMRVIIEAAVPFEEDHTKVRQVVEALCAEMAETHREHFLVERGELVEPPFLYGIIDISSAKGVGATYCIMALVRVESYWFVAREIRRLLLERFRQHGLHLSYPQRIFHQP